jgi:hypothetical protein
MPSRTTYWRHRTGRSKQRRPHGKVDYKGVAIHLCRKYFSDLWKYIHEDVMQEIELLAFEATHKKRIAGTRKRYGNGRDRMGIVQYSRAVQARLHAVRRNYGMDRNKTFFSLIEKKESLYYEID